MSSPLPNNMLTFVDVGTHIGQEVSSLFNFSSLTVSFSRRLLKNILFFRIRNVVEQFTCLPLLLRSISYFRQNRSDFFIISVEPNYRLSNRSIYCDVDMHLSLAIAQHKEFSFQINKLFISNQNPNSQGNSLYDAKHNVDPSSYIYTPTVDSDLFCHLIKDYIPSEGPIVLRLNCEGSESYIIESFLKYFSDRVCVVMGSLKDVSEIHGTSTYNSMLGLLEKSSVPFIPFSQSISTWPAAHRFLLSIFE